VLFASDNGCTPGSDSGRFRTDNSGADVGEIGSMQRYSKLGIDWPNVSNTPFKLYKTNAHKGGTCTPLIAYWPKGIEGKNRISHKVGHFIDFMPTFIDISGAAYPAEFKGEKVVPMQGQSLLPVFQNKEVERRKPIYWSFGKGKAVRYENWRLVSDGGQPWSLYNMVDDKTETNDLSRKHPEVVSKLNKLYQDWIESHPAPKKRRKSR